MTLCPRRFITSMAFEIQISREWFALAVGDFQIRSGHGSTYRIGRDNDQKSGGCIRLQLFYLANHWLKQTEHQIRKRRRQQRTVDNVQYPPEAGYQLAAVFHFSVALHEALQQIPGLA